MHRRLRSALIVLLTLAPLQAATVELEWDPNSEPDLAGYIVYRSETSGSSYRPVVSSLVPGTHFQDDTAQPGVTYYYVVTAVNLSGLESGFSNQVSVTVGFPPVAEDDNSITDEDVPVTIDVLANDSDPDGDTLSVGTATQGQRGQVVVSGSQLRYLPSRDFNGTDSFSYTVHDGRGGSDQAEVTVQVLPVNDPPEAVDDQVRTRLETGLTIAVLLNDRDIDNDPLSVSGIGLAAHGSAQINLDQTIRYQPEAAFTGIDSFEYMISDGLGGASAAQVVVTVRPPNRPPLAVDDAVEIDEDTAAMIAVLTNDSDPDGDPLSLLAVGAGAGGSLQMQPGNRVLYTPQRDFNGQDSFTYTIGDGEGASAQARVLVGVRPVNDAPLIEAGEAQRVGSTAFVSLLGEAHDPDGDAMTFRWRQRAGPAVSLQGSDNAEAFFRAPSVEEDLLLEFDLTVSDGQLSVTDRIQVSVTPEPPHRIYFPARIPQGSLGGEEPFVGVAILNPEDTSNEVILTGVSSSGEEMALLPHSVLSARQQRAFVAGQVEPQGEELAVLIAEGRQGTIEGFFMLGNSGQTLLDGIGGALQASDLLYFPLARTTDEGMTAFFLINPSLDTSSSADLFLYSPGGDLLQKASLQLPPQGSLATRLIDLFAEISLEDGYIKMLSSSPLQGFQLERQISNLATLAAQPAQQAHRLYVPHFFVDPAGGTTFLRILNAGSETLLVEVSCFADESNAPSVTSFSLDPGAIWQADVAGLLDSSTTPVSGYIELEVNGVLLPPKVIGSVIYQGGQAKTYSSLPMLHQPQRGLRFLQVAQSTQLGMFTGLAILNHQEQPVTVDVKAYDQQGALSAETQITLPAKSRLVDLLNGQGYFGQPFDQVNGHLAVSSSLPIVAFALFGDFRGEFLAAIEGRGVSIEPPSN